MEWQDVCDYIGLCNEYMGFAGPDPVDEKREYEVAVGIRDLRKKMGLEPIRLRPLER